MTRVVYIPCERVLDTDTSQNGEVLQISFNFVKLVLLSLSLLV